MKYYLVNTEKIKGTSYKEVHKKTRRFYNEICKNTKRKPYIRSTYFKGEKIFLDLFWSHLEEKNRWDRLRRMRFLKCGICLIKKSKIKPIIQKNPNNHKEILYRFFGQSKDKSPFIVQIKENQNKKKWLISIFPE